MPYRNALLAAAVAALLLLPAGGAVAAGGDHTQSYTENVHGAFTEDFDTNPCSGAAITSVDATGNVVNHVQSAFEPAFVLPGLRGVRASEP